jgi:hypothetical protein
VTLADELAHKMPTISRLISPRHPGGPDYRAAHRQLFWIFGHHSETCPRARTLATVALLELSPALRHAATYITPV